MGKWFGGSTFQLEEVRRECMMRVREERHERGECVRVSCAMLTTNSGNHSSNVRPEKFRFLEKW